MKTKLFFACLVAGFLTLDQPVQGASDRTAAPSQTNSFEHRSRARQALRPAILSAPEVSGVIPRAIRGGDPLQLLNLRAPARYGTAEENVSLDPDVPGKWNGIKFFSISF